MEECILIYNRRHPICIAYKPHCVYGKEKQKCKERVKSLLLYEVLHLFPLKLHDVVQIRYVQYSQILDVIERVKDFITFVN